MSLHRIDSIYLEIHITEFLGKHDEKHDTQIRAMSDNLKVEDESGFKDQEGDTDPTFDNSNALNEYVPDEIYNDLDRDLISNSTSNSNQYAEVNCFTLVYWWDSMEEYISDGDVYVLGNSILEIQLMISLVSGDIEGYKSFSGIHHHTSKYHPLVK